MTDYLVLEVRDHLGADFDKLLAAVVRYNLCNGKEHRIDKRDSKRIRVKCSRGKECSFAVNAVLLVNGQGLRITRFEKHNCVGVSVRKRQLKTAVVSTVTNAVDRFVVARGRRGGNNAQLREIVKKDAGLDLKPSQVHRIIRAKVGGEQHLAHFRIIRNYIRAIAESDEDGRYTVEATPLGNGQLQFKRLFCCPSGCSRTFQHFEKMGSAGATHLKSVVQGQLFLLTTYDANNAVTILAFGIAGSEDSDTWSWFLRNCLQCFPQITLLMSDGAEGVESHAVQLYLDSCGVERSRCAWHILQKNLKASNLRYKDEDVKELWMVVRSRTVERAEILLSKLSEHNNELTVWFRSRAEYCCAYTFLDKGLRRRGVCTSNSSEQSNSFLSTTRERPICDVIADLIGKMCDDRFHRRRNAIELMNNGHKLTTRALAAHSSTVTASTTLLCEPEEIAPDGSFTCIVRRSSGKTSYRVRVTPTYSVECPCRHYEEMLRPCDHAVAAIRLASTTVGLSQYQDVMDCRWIDAAWHLETWRAQHSGVIKRVSLVGQAGQLEQEDIIPPKLHSRPGRKRVRPYEPSESMPRTCPACGRTGHFSRGCPSPSSAHLSQSKRAGILEVADSLVIDLTQDE